MRWNVIVVYSFEIISNSCFEKLLMLEKYIGNNSQIGNLKKNYYIHLYIYKSNENKYISAFEKLTLKRWAQL